MHTKSQSDGSVVYVLRVEDVESGLQWVVQRRYRDFFSLNEELVDMSHFAKEVEFPRKRITIRNTAKLIEMRIVALEQYTRKMLHILTVYATMDSAASKSLRHLQNFLGVDKYMDTVHPPLIDDQRYIELMAYRFMNDFTSPACQQCVRFITSVDLDSITEQGPDGYQAVLTFMRDALAEVEAFVQAQHQQQMVQTLRGRRPDLTAEEQESFVRKCIRRQVEAALYLPLRRTVFRIVYSCLAQRSRTMHRAITLLQKASPNFLQVDPYVPRARALPATVKAFRRVIQAYLPADQAQLIVQAAMAVMELHKECSAEKNRLKTLFQGKQEEKVRSQWGKEEDGKRRRSLRRNSLPNGATSGAGKEAHGTENGGAAGPASSSEVLDSGHGRAANSGNRKTNNDDDDGDDDDDDDDDVALEQGRLASLSRRPSIQVIRDIFSRQRQEDDLFSSSDSDTNAPTPGTLAATGTAAGSGGNPATSVTNSRSGDDATGGSSSGSSPRRRMVRPLSRLFRTRSNSTSSNSGGVGNAGGLSSGAVSGEGSPGPFFPHEAFVDTNNAFLVSVHDGKTSRRGSSNAASGAGGAGVEGGEAGGGRGGGRSTSSEFDGSSKVSNNLKRDMSSLAGSMMNTGETHSSNGGALTDQQGSIDTSPQSTDALKDSSRDVQTLDSCTTGTADTTDSASAMTALNERLTMALGIGPGSGEGGSGVGGAARLISGVEKAEEDFRLFDSLLRQDPDRLGSQQTLRRESAVTDDGEYGDARDARDAGDAGEDIGLSSGQCSGTATPTNASSNALPAGYAGSGAALSPQRRPDGIAALPPHMRPHVGGDQSASQSCIGRGEVGTDGEHGDCSRRESTSSIDSNVVESGTEHDLSPLIMPSSDATGNRSGGAGPTDEDENAVRLCLAMLCARGRAILHS